MRASVKMETDLDALQAGVVKGRTRGFPLPPHPIAAEQAREVVRLVSAAWRLGEDALDDLLLVTAELVTNAMKVDDVFSLALCHQAETVRVEVWDNSEAAPDRQRASLDRVDGRGLQLVEACSKDWGWRLEGRGGKTVWAIVEVTGPTTTALAPSE
jgi:two-component sensor histidine kinase